MTHPSDISEKQTPTGIARRSMVLEKLGVQEAVWTQAHKRFPVQWPVGYLRQVRSSAGTDPVAKMGRPDLRELESNPNDLADAIGDHLKRPHPFLVRKHADRIIVLTTKRCHFFCRFCFRREEPPTAQTELKVSDWEAVFTYLAKEKALREVILSGGDPLTLSNRQLFALKSRIEALPHITHWRIHSRAPVHFPQRVDQELVRVLARGLPLRIVTHFNHSQETSPAVRVAIHRIHRFRIPILNQAVLLAGVNDSLQAQTQLWQAMGSLGIGSYYLHHPDRVAGNAHFRVSIANGLDLYHRMKQVLGKLLPQYVVDLPDGSGKVPVADMALGGDNLYVYRHASGQVSHYRDIV